MKLQMPQKPAVRRALVGTGFLAGAVLMSASIFATGPTAQPEVKKEKAWPVSIIEVAPDALHPSFTAFGRVESSDVARLRTDLVARVDAVLVNVAIA